MSDAAGQSRDGMGLNGGGNGINKAHTVLKKVVWDHSAIGSSIIYPLSKTRRLTIALEPDGVYEFKTLPVLAKQFPMEMWQALVPSDDDGLPEYGIPR